MIADIRAESEILPGNPSAENGTPCAQPFSKLIINYEPDQRHGTMQQGTQKKGQLALENVIAIKCRLCVWQCPGNVCQGLLCTPTVCICEEDVQIQPWKSAQFTVVSAIMVGHLIMLLFCL